LAPTTLGIAKEEILYVSANSFDAAGGKSFGLQVCWVNRTNMPFDILGVTPDLVVRDIEQLAKLLG
jgi:2-haloacid dehalogenase